MNTLIVIAHPNEQSYNYALLERVQKGLIAAGHTVKVKDLYAEAFNPLVDGGELANLQNGVVADEVKKEQELLSWAEGLIILYPLWWFDRPAILKGWFDRVLTHGYAFSYTSDGVKGLLNPRKALVIVTAGGGIEEFKQMGMSEEDLVKSVTIGTLGFCGVQEVSHKVLFQVPVVDDEARGVMLDEVEGLAESF